MKKRTQKYARERGVEVRRGGKVHEDTEGNVYIVGAANIYEGDYASKVVNISGDAFIAKGASVPKLVTVGGAYINKGASVPALTTVGRDADIGEGVSVPALTTVGGDAYIGEGVNVPALTTVGRNADIGEGVSVPKLTTVDGDAYIGKGVNVPALTTVEGNLYIRGADISASAVIKGSIFTWKENDWVEWKV